GLFSHARRARVHAIWAGRLGDIEKDVGFLIHRAVIDVEQPLVDPEIVQRHADALRGREAVLLRTGDAPVAGEGVRQAVGEGSAVRGVSIARLGIADEYRGPRQSPVALDD